MNKNLPGAVTSAAPSPNETEKPLAIILQHPSREPLLSLGLDVSKVQQLAGKHGVPPGKVVGLFEDYFKDIILNWKP